jgi:hypothetical protein
MTSPVWVINKFLEKQEMDCLVRALLPEFRRGATAHTFAMTYDASSKGVALCGATPLL